MKLLKRLALVSHARIDMASSFENSEPTSIDIILAFLTGELTKFRQLIRSEKIRYQSELQNPRNEKAAHSNSANRNYPPIIKAKTILKHHDINAQISSTRLDLVDKSVLCVGGQLKLYPQYGQLIEVLGGRFIAFHDIVNGTSLKELLQLLQKADMIICPIDCVNHEAFLIVKQYCESFGKLCVLLDRSTVATFHQGIHELIRMTKKVESLLSNRTRSG